MKNLGYANDLNCMIKEWLEETLCKKFKCKKDHNCEMMSYKKAD